MMEVSATDRETGRPTNTRSPVTEDLSPIAYMDPLPVYLIKMRNNTSKFFF